MQTTSNDSPNDTGAQTAPRVSVIVPCYNREDTAAEAITSVLDQSYRDLEVIAVDDGSTDGTWEVLQSLDDPRLRLARNPRKGVSSARNHGVSLVASATPWVAFQDSDDVWLPLKLERQMAGLEDSDNVASYCGMQVKADAQPQTPVQARFPDPAITPLSGDILPSLIKSSYLSTQMLIIRRDVFDRVAGFDEELQALVDWELMLRVAQEGPVDFIDEDLVIQRMSDNSITKSPKKRTAAQERILTKHQDLIAKYPGMMAHHLHRLAGAHRMTGDYARAAGYARRACSSVSGADMVKHALNFLYLKSRTLLD